MQVLQTAEVKPTEAAVPQDRPPVVLLVDDDPTTLHMLSGMLQQEGIVTLNADTVEKARSVAADEAFDLAVLDVHLPDGNGLDLCRWVRQHPACAGVPVLMLSAEQDVRTKVAGFAIRQLGTGLCPQYEARRCLRSVFYELKNESARLQHAA
jgi:PleD family two-component response regulator